ncbi:hypothetical protein NX784_17495 [Massilia pinisoli]|uniref:Large polyvalent protein associated domain-containing protein n=1 Tax=Massilia pinisoli TaxID=1772194 RepID=A0ABT1ZTZ7_9BURK|nr:hypothetical protein [Massilia pinisoli]MCS0583388.1 hypothetical protein [Massilia pinisoli]
MGDEKTFAMTVDGKEYIARTDAARAIAEIAKGRSVGLAQDDAATVDLGEFYGMPLHATFSRGDDKQFWTSLAVLRPDGSTLTSGETKLREDWNYTTSAMRTALDELEKLVQPARLEYVRETIEHRLARAQATLPELQARQVGPFKEQAELDEKNARLEEVIRQLSSGPSTPGRNITLRGNPLQNVDGSYRRQEPMPGLYRRPRESVITAPEKMLPVEVITAEVQKRIEKFAHQPRIVIRYHREGIVPGATKQCGIMGATYRGTVYLLRDALPGLTAVQETPFHKLVHQGIRQFIDPDEYIKTKLNLYQASPDVRAYTDAWAAGPDGCP